MSYTYRHVVFDINCIHISFYNTIIFDDTTSMDNVQ